MKCERLVDVGRRRFLKGGMAGMAGAAVLPDRAARAQNLARVSYPSERLANVSDLTVNKPLDIAYPDPDSPGVLIKLGVPVESGVGPDRDLVAYSTLCPHKGWLLSYNADDKTLNCPGHFSRFDCEVGGQQTWGHATQNLPQFQLHVDENGDVFANGVDELIYGRLSNVLEG
ncbi:MAG: arsenate reductase (azurin) small subunit [Pseudomonadota bacterium]